MLTAQSKARIIRVYPPYSFNLRCGMNRNNPEPCELAEIIYDRPLSGAFEEVSYGSDQSNFLWVKFSDKDGAGEWIGKFSAGNCCGGLVIKMKEPDQFFIFAAGHAYIFDATNRIILSQSVHDEIRDIVFDPIRQVLITADLKNLYWMDWSGKILFSKQIAVDWISELKIEGNILTGLACKDYGDDEQRFWFDLDSLKILRWEKPWWKFW